MKDYLLDTNFVLRYLLNDIPSQADIIESFLLKAKLGTISLFVPLLVFVEIDFALSKFYHFKKEEIAEKLKFIAEIEYLDVEKREILTNALNFYNSHSVSFVDALFLVESKKSGRELLTFDKKLEAIKLKL